MYLKFKIVIVPAFEFVLGVGSYTNLGRSEGRDAALDGLCIDFSETSRYDCCADVDSRVIPVNKALLGIEVDEEIRLVSDCCSRGDFDGGLLFLRGALRPVGACGSLLLPVVSMLGVVEVVYLCLDDKQHC